MRRGGSESMRSPAQPAAQLRISPADPRIPGTQTAMASEEGAPVLAPHRDAVENGCRQWRGFGQGTRCTRTHARTHARRPNCGAWQR